MSQFKEFQQKLNRSTSNPSFLSILGGIFIIYFIYGKLGLQFASLNSITTSIWVPTGIAFASFLLFGLRVWPAIFFGALIVSLTTGEGLLSSLLIGLGNTLEGIVGFYLITKFAGGKKVFESSGNFYKFVFIAILASLINALFGAVMLFIDGFTNFIDYLPVFTTLWIGDTLSALIFTPPLLLWGTNPRLRRDKSWEFILFVLLTLLVVLVISRSSFYFSYLIIPILIWISLRFNTKGTSTAIAFLSIISIFIAQHFSSLSRGDQNTSLLITQTFLAVISIVIIPLSITLTQRKMSSREDKKLALIVKSTQEAIIGKTLEGEIISWNSGAEKLYGYTAEEVIGENISVISIGGKEPEFEKIVEIIKKGEKIEHLEVIRIRKDGSLVDINLKASAIVDEKGKIVGVSNIHTDITEQKRKEEIEKQKRIIEEERLRNEFIANAAHELRTPLAIIKGNTDLALGSATRKLIDPESALRAIDAEVVHLSNILEDLLSFTTKNEKLKNEAREEIEISDFIGKIVERCRALGHQKNISIELLPIPEEKILGNPTYLDKVFANIIKNSITYGREKGFVNISGTKDEKFLYVRIKDSGIGISPENLPHIFERFFRADKARTQEEGRTGLGLAIVKQIVEEHGGTIRAESELDVGSTFVVSLPLANT